MDRTIKAIDFLNHHYAGLSLWGLDEEGYEWVGNDKQWNAYKTLCAEYENR